MTIQPYCSESELAHLRVPVQHQTCVPVVAAGQSNRCQAIEQAGRGTGATILTVVARGGAPVAGVVFQQERPFPAGCGIAGDTTRARPLSRRIEPICR